MELNHKKAIEEGCYFDCESADRAVRYIEKYAIPKGFDKPIKLLDWQKNIVRELFGWKRPDGSFRYKRATISTGKKNGKTIFVSALIQYGMFGGLRPSALNISCSTTAKNAEQVFDELQYSIRLQPKLKKISKIVDYKREITVPSRKTKYLCSSSDAPGIEGQNAFIAICDETHAHHKGGEIYRAIEFAPAASGGFFINISTAGSDTGHFFYSVFKYAKDVQDDKIIDTSLLPFICTPDETDDIENVNTWRKANPSLGISFSEDDFRRDMERAKNSSTADFISFKRYRLNMWVLAEDNYLQAQDFDRCKNYITDHDLKDYPLFAACDLSQTTDPCSISLLWSLGERRYYIKTFGFVCEDGVAKRKADKANMPQYQEFKEDGCFTITKGQINDYPRIKEFILGLKDRYNLKEVIFDGYNAMEMMQELMNKKIEVYKFPQTHKYYNDPTKQFEIAVKEGRIQHDGKQSWLRWCLINTKLDYDNYENVKPSRDKSNDKIDGAVTAIMAFGRAMNENVNKKVSVYESRGALFL